MSEISITEINELTKLQNYLCEYLNGKSDVLDEIKKEIEQLPNYYYAICRPNSVASCSMVELDEVVRIIDKRQTGSEDER